MGADEAQLEELTQSGEQVVKAREEQLDREMKAITQAGQVDRRREGL